VQGGPSKSTTWEVTTTMKTWRPSRPSPAMIVALIALCVALGGSAVAATKIKLAPKNTVNSASVVNNSLKLQDFKKSERGKLKGPKGDQGIQGPAGTPDGYTKTEADGKFLGKGDKAADSDKLDGKDSSQFMGGQGAVSYGKLVLDLGQSKTLLTMDSLGTIEVTCSGTAATVTADVRFRNTSGRTAEVMEDHVINDTADEVNVVHQTLANNELWSFPPTVDGLNGIGQFHWNISSVAGGLLGLLSGSSAATSTVAAMTDTANNDKCTFWGQYTANSTDPITFVIGG
jgi:hypothetical protein